MLGLQGVWQWPALQSFLSQAQFEFATLCVCMPVLFFIFMAFFGVYLNDFWQFFTLSQAPSVKYSEPSSGAYHFSNERMPSYLLNHFTLVCVNC